jgi:hypothetical protein
LTRRGVPTFLSFARTYRSVPSRHEARRLVSIHVCQEASACNWRLRGTAELANGSPLNRHNFRFRRLARAFYGSFSRQAPDRFGDVLFKTMSATLVGVRLTKSIGHAFNSLAKLPTSVVTKIVRHDKQGSA